MPKSFQEADGHQWFPLPFGLSFDFEFRVPGLRRTTFLIRGVEVVVNRYYTTSIYEADFSNPSGAPRQASESEWASATPVPWPIIRADTADTLEYLKSIKSIGLDHEKGKTGVKHSGVLLSPARDLVVVQSYTGTLGRCGGSDIPGDLSLNCIDIRGPHGRLFFDVYSTDTGRKLITLTGKFSRAYPSDVFGQTGFVTERYFFIPIDDKREKCLVCEFGRGR
jgi:hypothetical protein